MRIGVRRTADGPRHAQGVQAHVIRAAGVGIDVLHEGREVCIVSRGQVIREAGPRIVWCVNGYGRRRWRTERSTDGRKQLTHRPDRTTGPARLASTFAQEAA